MIAKIYRSLIGNKTRELIYKFFLSKFLFFLRNYKVIVLAKLAYAFQLILPKNDYTKSLIFIGKNGLTSYPGNYSLKYKNSEFEILFDDVKKMNYIVHKGKNLYFTPSYSIEKIRSLYIELITEQDVESPHRYIINYDELKGKNLLDIGAAEGIFSLENIELLNHVYLFETEQFWIDALKATFEPWIEKVTIIQKYVSDKSKDNMITIDDFFKGQQIDSLFFKMDIEGAEMTALKGAKNTIQACKDIQLAICTYHRPTDPKEISNFINAAGCKSEFSKGYLYWGKRLNKTLLRASKL